MIQESFQHNCMYMSKCSFHKVTVSGDHTSSKARLLTKTASTAHKKNQLFPANSLQNTHRFCSVRTCYA
uniref:Uncharacterized protein n=1 Tax=Anguilla anguilla TaxID=7936 RepID=A0A0E9WQ01_ANGAN